jgi:hypothetical protein
VLFAAAAATAELGFLCRPLLLLLLLVLTC